MASASRLHPSDDQDITLLVNPAGADADKSIGTLIRCGADALLQEIAEVELQNSKNWTGDYLRLENISVGVANMVRRSVMTRLPAAAVTVLNDFVNDGVLEDEIVAHRIGMVPISYKDGRTLAEVAGQVSGRINVCSTGAELTPVTASLLELEAPFYVPEECKNVVLTHLPPGGRFAASLVIEVCTARSHSRHSCVSSNDLHC